MKVSPDKDLIAIGKLASELRVTVRTIDFAVAELGIQPALMLNRIAHFDGDQVERILALIRSRGAGSTVAHLANNLQ
ncbi:MAG: hypothetical protein AB7G28_25135 [Pirellulales bacterium]